MWHTANLKAKAARDELAGEAERLLHGEASDAFAGKTGLVPAWVPVNALAHCEPELLQDLAAARHADDPGGWDAMLAYLASEILATSRTIDEVARIQREALVPLELALLSREIQPPHSPAQLAHLIRSSIRGATGEPLARQGQALH